VRVGTWSPALLHMHPDSLVGVCLGLKARSVVKVRPALCCKAEAQYMVDDASACRQHVMQKVRGVQLQQGFACAGHSMPH
jgi:hypothetical protein